MFSLPTTTRGQARRIHAASGLPGSPTRSGLFRRVPAQRYGEDVVPIFIHVGTPIKNRNCRQGI